MIVLITLTTAGTDVGPFDLFSNTDGYSVAFETGVSRSALVAGYTSSLVPNGTTIVRVYSNGVCVNYIDLTISTTTTTTTTYCNCVSTITLDVTQAGSFDFIDCLSVFRSTLVGTGVQTLNYGEDGCITKNTQSGSAMYSILEYGPCCTPTTTTTSSSTSTSTSTTTSTTTLAPVNGTINIYCNTVYNEGEPPSATVEVSALTGGSGTYQITNTLYLSEAGALGGTYVNAGSSPVNYSLVENNTWWVGIRDTNNPTNKIAKQIIVNCPEITTTTTSTSSTTTTTTTAGPAYKSVYVNNTSSSGYVTIYGVEVDSIVLIEDTGNFPLTAGQNLVGQAFNSSTGATVYVSLSTPADCPVTVYDTYGGIQCQTSPGGAYFTVDFSGPGSVTITVGEQGTACS